VYQGRRLKDTVIKNERFSGFSLRFLWEIMGGAQPKIYGVKIWLTRQDSDKRVLVAAAANLHKSGCPLERLIIFNLFSQQKWLKVNSLCVLGLWCHIEKILSLWQVHQDFICCYLLVMDVVVGLHEWRSWFILKVIYLDLNPWSRLMTLLKWLYVTHLHWNIESM